MLPDIRQSLFIFVKLRQGADVMRLVNLHGSSEIETLDSDKCATLSQTTWHSWQLPSTHCTNLSVPSGIRRTWRSIHNWGSFANRWFPWRPKAILFSDLVLMPSCSRQVCTAEILFIWSMRSHGHVKQWSKYMRNITMPTQKVQSNMHLPEMPLLCPQLRMQLAYVKNSNGMCLDQVWDKGYEKNGHQSSPIT